MVADHAIATATAGVRPADDTHVDPWLRMRFAPVQEDVPTVSSAAVRDVMRAIAGSPPDAAMLERERRRVRALLDCQRTALRQRLADGTPVDQIAHAEARLLDGTVIGLCHLWHLLAAEPACSVPPLAVIARGDYGRRKLALEASADLLFLLETDPVRRKQGCDAAQFVARELAALGWQVSGAKRTVRGCLAETHLDPAIASDLCAARLVWGAQDLLADLQAALTQGNRREVRRDQPMLAGVPAPCVTA
jgi:UTP:GlnB (protein PII) uridylyltransferase